MTAPPDTPGGETFSGAVTPIDARPTPSSATHSDADAQAISSKLESLPPTFANVQVAGDADGSVVVAVWFPPIAAQKDVDGHEVRAPAKNDGFFVHAGTAAPASVEVCAEPEVSKATHSVVEAH